MDNKHLIELLKMAIEMRHAQRDYFKSRRDRSKLIHARVLEAEFDKKIASLSIDSVVNESTDRPYNR